jgi:hypothetical protein
MPMDPGGLFWLAHFTAGIDDRQRDAAGIAGL